MRANKNEEGTGSFQGTEKATVLTSCFKTGCGRSGKSKHGREFAISETGRVQAPA